MKLTRKHVIIGIIVIAIAVTIFIIVRKKMKAKSELGTIEEPNVGTLNPISGPNPTMAGSVFPLKKGSKGLQVRQLQAYLLREFGFSGKIDGDFGPITEAAVIKNLQRNSVSEDYFKKVGMDKIAV